MDPAAGADLGHLPPDPRELFTDIHVVSLPLVTRFRGITNRELMLVRGPAGWAEFSPFVEYQTPEAARWLRATIESATQPYPTPVRNQVQVNATVPACPASQVPQVLARFGPTTAVKIKIAEHGSASLREDLARVRRVLTETDARIRLDANGAYTVGQALDALAQFTRLPGLVDRLEYVEQPVATVEDLARVRKHVGADGIRIAADESIRKATDPLRVAQLEAADHIVVKAQPLGGVRAAARVVEQCGLPATVSSALESSVGLSAGVALAAYLPGEFAAGLATGALLGAEVVARPLRPRAGVLPTGRVVPDLALVSRYAAGPARVDWWIQRLRDCWEALRGASGADQAG